LKEHRVVPGVLRSAGRLKAGKRGATDVNWEWRHDIAGSMLLKRS